MCGSPEADAFHNLGRSICQNGDVLHQEFDLTALFASEYIPLTETTALVEVQWRQTSQPCHFVSLSTLKRANTLLWAETYRDSLLGKLSKEDTEDEHPT